MEGQGAFKAKRGLVKAGKRLAKASRILTGKEDPFTGGNRCHLSDEEILKIMKNSRPVSSFCRELGISRTLYYNVRSWRTAYKNRTDRERFEALEADARSS